MLKPGGYLNVTSRDTGDVTFEQDTFTCAHGNEVVRVRPGMASQAPFCTKCMKPICLKCHEEMARTLTCKPFEVRLLEMESRGRFRRALIG